MKSKSARGVWFCGALFFCFCSIAFAHPGEDLEQAWKARDEEKLVELHTPTCWEDETDSGRRVFEQIDRKQLEFRLRDYRHDDSRAVATYGVYARGELVDRVFTYFENDLVVAYDEQEEHAEFFLMGLVPGRLRLEDLPGCPELDALGQRYLETPPAEFQQPLADAAYTRSHLLAETGRAILLYQGAEEPFALIVQRQGLDWRPTDISYLPSVTRLIPEDEGLVACSTRMSELTEQLETYFHFHGQRYPENLDEIAVPISCPVSQKSYRYAVTVDFRWYGLVCEGDSHPISHYPAASRSSGVRLASTGSGYTGCENKLRSLLPLLEKYKAANGRYPEILAYLVDEPGIHLPRCSDQNKIWAPNETDYALMHLPGGLHLFCTTVEHCGQGFAPLQPSYINGLPAKARFLLKTGTEPPRIKIE